MKDISPVKFSVNQGDTTLNVYHVDKGQGLPSHNHLYSHLTFCHAGSILITKENATKIMNKDSKPVNLKAGEWHEIEALEDNTIFVNVFSNKHR